MSNTGKRSVFHLSATVSALACLGAQATAQEAPPPPADEDPTMRVETVDVYGMSTAGMLADRALPLQVLSGDEFTLKRKGTLGETLATLPGVHMDNFGGGASRPVIRGQTVPRIEILSDGATLFDASSVSPDHAVTTDPLLLDAIEVLRGPGAAIYGGNALNGAVNLIDSKVPKTLPEDGFDGAAELRYGTGDEEKSLAGRATFSLGQIALHAEGSSRDAENYNVPEDFGSSELRDSFAAATSYSFGASWVTGKGYVGAAYTVQEAEYGLPGHSHINGVCHTHGPDLHCAAHGEFEDPFGSSDDHTAYIDLRSERVDVRADYDDLIPGFRHVRLRGSYTDYSHDEIDGPSVFTQYTNEVWDGRIELTHAPVFGFTGTMGVQYTDGTFTGININDMHEEPTNLGFVQPFDYVTENAGLFLTERRSFGPVELELALRKDWREISIPVPEYRIGPEYVDLIRRLEIALGYGEGGWVRNQAKGFSRNNPGAEHDPFSAALGATWTLENGYSVALSLAHTERPPSVRELYAYGNNLATNSYEVGLSQTRRASSSFPERRTDVLEAADSINLTFRKSEGRTQFEIGAFHQDIEDYVFARLIETDSETGIPHNYLLYVAADARFTGIDGYITHQLTDALSVTVFGDFVRADLSGEDDELPRIPPGRVGVRHDWTSGPLSADIELIRTFGQDRVAAYESETDGYNIVNATLSYQLDGGDRKAPLLYVRGTNLTDELAFVHTSFVKDQSPLRGRSFTVGIRQEF